LRTFFAELSLRPEAQNPPQLKILSRPLAAGEKPREIFISYAWGDDTPEGKIRAEAVDRLYAAFRTTASPRSVTATRCGPAT
jgi:hypothetical protein